MHNTQENCREIVENLILLILPRQLNLETGKHIWSRNVHKVVTVKPSIVIFYSIYKSSSILKSIKLKK